MKSTSHPADHRTADAVVSIREKIAACRSTIDALEDELLAIAQRQGQCIGRACERPELPRAADLPDPVPSRSENESAGFSSLRRPLSPRQMQVVELLRRGLTSSEMAHELGLRRSTVGRIRQAVYTRLGVRGAAQALVAARRLGLLAAEQQPARNTQCADADSAAPNHRRGVFGRIRAARLKRCQIGGATHAS